ncbi:MAG: DUF928 domain-containing protein [Pleurocapsa sp.]
MKSYYNLILFVLLIVFGFALTNTAIAEIQTTVRFQPPPEEEQPKRTEGAASRQTTQCAVDSLMPQSNAGDRFNLASIVPQQNYGLTTLERPDLWIYLPKTSAKQAILSIREEGNIPHWQQSVELTERAGVTGIRLADDAPILKLGKNYQWAVILICCDRPNPNDPVVTSWIKRVAPKNIKTPSTSKLELASTYAQQGIWYDALNILISEKSSQENWCNLWSEYLESAGLDKIADKPVIENLLFSE